MDRRSDRRFGLNQWNERLFSEEEVALANILIADDEELIRSFIKRIVEGLGHKAFLAANGITALDIFKKQEIDLSFVDVRMPEMDGLTFLHEAKKINPVAVVIVITGFPSAESITETVEEQGYTYITKPLSVQQIIDLVQRGLTGQGGMV
jgi:DNA-binding NtrC family response regulator